MPIFDDVKIIERPPEEETFPERLKFQKKKRKCYPYAFSFKIKRNLRE